MKVYVVERGCYSDRYVSGVFSSLEMAEADIALRTEGKRSTWNSEGDVTEYEMDEEVGDVKRPLWRAYIDLDTGEIKLMGSHMHYGKPSERSQAPKENDCRASTQMSPWGWHFGRLYGEAYSFVSQEHAVKLAVEFRQLRMRERSGAIPDREVK